MHRPVAVPDFARSVRLACPALWYYEVMCLVAYNEHRARSFADDPLCDASKKHMRDRTTTMRADDDQIGRVVFGVSHDLHEWVPLDDLPYHWKLIRYVDLEFVQLLGSRN